MNEITLNLARYEDGIAHFESFALPLMQGQDTTIVVQMRREEWIDLGRPDTINVGWVILSD